MLCNHCWPVPTTAQITLVWLLSLACCKSSLTSYCRSDPCCLDWNCMGLFSRELFCFLWCLIVDCARWIALATFKTGGSLCFSFTILYLSRTCRPCRSLVRVKGLELEERKIDTKVMRSATKNWILNAQLCHVSLSTAYRYLLAVLFLFQLAAGTCSYLCSRIDGLLCQERPLGVAV